MNNANKINLLTYKKKNDMINFLYTSELRYKLCEKALINIIVDYMMDTVMLKITFFNHNETHSGYCSGADVEEIDEYENSCVYEIDTTMVRYDEDNEIIFNEQTTHSKNMTKTYDNIIDLEIDSACIPQSGSGYCGCNSTKNITSVVIATKKDLDLHDITYYNYDSENFLKNEFNSFENKANERYDLGKYKMIENP